ncbi:hypothetical protein BS50DRAFT_569976 [Corynespora cassiicola Philippines]|uniref:Uncharacterized protein n=1 Tax=Corynespora cassiicola Philippines TaxID=1448308 RepID=A0A2T2P484_CORCC|nr:hypothetical protein BS50DRAFT_569976 [Corynespora cassiicola Philippines]
MPPPPPGIPPHAIGPFGPYHLIPGNPPFLWPQPPGGTNWPNLPQNGAQGQGQRPRQHPTMQPVIFSAGPLAPLPKPSRYPPPNPPRSPPL